MNTSRRQFVRGSLICGIAALSESTRSALAQTGPVAAVAPGPEVDAFKTAQQRLFQKYDTSVRSRYVKLEEPALTAHVIEAGRGDPVLMLHGGGSFACQFAPLIGLLRHEFHLFAADRPGCGLTDKIDYRHIVLRQHAVDVVTSLLDSLDLPRAALIGNSMGGLWALQFALAKPERVAGLVLLGEPAWSGAVPHPPPPAGKIPSIEGVRAAYSTRLVADVTRVPEEILQATLAANRLPGAALSWDTLITKFLQDKDGTYHLRPELKNLRPATLFIWGDKDKFGSPTLGREMTAMAPNARCEILSDAGHIIWLDKLEQCAALTVEFLKSSGKST